MLRRRHVAQRLHEMCTVCFRTVPAATYDGVGLFMATGSRWRSVGMRGLAYSARVQSKTIPGARVWLAALVPPALLAMGTVGYVVVEGWDWFDALYMTTITLTTIGFGEVNALSHAGRALTMILALGGAFSLAAAATFVLRSVVSGELASVFGRQRMEKALATVSDHVIVCGFGRVGRLVTQEFLESGVGVVVVDNNAERLKAAPGLYVHGNVTKDSVLKAAGIARARALVTVVPSDADNLYVTMSARLLSEKLFIVARAEGEDADEKLTRAGANRVVSPTALGGQRVAQAVLRPAVLDFIDLASRTQHLELQVEETTLRSGSALIGKTVREAKLRDSANVLVVAVKRADGQMLFNPPPDVAFELSDTLIVLGGRAGLDTLESLATGGTAAKK
jgi:voltage-gated potassium channel